jgi:pimeloyl-ACP methyl ester carboxylesterase
MRVVVIKAKSFYSDDMKGNIRYYDILGKNPAILFIHGLDSASTMGFFSVTSYFLAKNRRIILLDFLGSGLSDYNKNFYHSIANLAKIIANFICSNKLNSLILVGHSMGGSIVIKLASLIPRAIEK